MPGIIQSFDATKLSCTVQVALEGTQTKPDGSQVQLTVTVLVDVPVQFPRGGPYIFTFPVAKGDECLVVMASRCIDAWWQSGGVQKQQEFRMHDINDGFAVMGFFSNPNVPANFQTAAAELRSLDRVRRVTLHDNGAIDLLNGSGSIILGSDGNTTINGNLHVTGTSALDGAVTSHGEGTFNSHTVGHHTHTQPNDSHGDAEAPTNTPTG